MGFDLLQQLGCFFQTQALGHSLRSDGQVLGLAPSREGGHACWGIRMEGPFGSLVGGGFCSAPTNRLQQCEVT